MKSFKELFISEGSEALTILSKILDKQEDVLGYNTGIHSSLFDEKYTEVKFSIDKKRVFIGSSSEEYTASEYKSAIEKQGVKVEDFKFKSYMIEDEAFIDISMSIIIRL